MKLKSKLIQLLTGLMLVVGLVVPTASSVSAATDPNAVPPAVDWAFTADSVVLHDAILEAYPHIDANGDGYISVTEAAAPTGYITINDVAITGTLDGLEHFTMISGLNLTNTGYTGEIPAFITQLTRLETLNLSKNNITGSIPSDIGSLTNLERLDLSGNTLTGSIPDSIGLLSQLSSFYLYDNQLTGPLPTSMGNLSNLQDFRAQRNGLTGAIPSELGNITGLKRIILGANNLSGSIPASIGNITALEMLSLDSNQLTGTIPSELGNLTNLNYLTLLRNQLSGPIPSSLGNLTNLVTLHLGDNQLTGEIPVSLANLTKVETFSLGDNNLSGVIPSEIYSLPKLTEFSVTNNVSITGDITTGFQDHPTLKILITKGAGTTQRMPKSAALKVFIGDLLNATNDDLYNGVTQEDINSAIEVAKNIETETTMSNYWQEELAELNAKIAEAQRIMDERNDAINKVEDLTDDQGILNPDVTQEDIDEAQDAVNKLPDGTLKDELQGKIDDAQKQLDERNAKELEVNELPGTGNHNVNTLTGGSATWFLVTILLAVGLIYKLTRKRYTVK